MQVCLVVPWGLQFLFYAFLYKAFPRDRDASAELERSGRRGDSTHSCMLDSDAAAEEPDQDAPHGARAALRCASRELTKHGPDGHHALA